MAIYRTRQKSNFTIINNTSLKDKRLSLKAKGLIAYMLSLPDDWVFYETELVNHSTDGKHSVNSALKELQDAGYLIKKQSRSEDGKFSNIDWELFDEPQNADLATFAPLPEKPSTDKPSTEKPSTENQTLLNTNTTNNLSIQSTNNTNSTAKAEPPIPYSEIVDYLNLKTKSNFRSSAKETQRLIKARFNDGFTFENFKQVIDTKANEWLFNQQMAIYLRPKTLFGTNFESYLNQRRQTFSNLSLDKPQIPETQELPF